MRKAALLAGIILGAAFLIWLFSGPELQKQGRGSVRLELVGKFSSPVWVEGLPGREMLVVEKGGKIIHYPSGRTWLDISREVLDSGEGGLLSMELSPRWERDRTFWIYYTGLDGDQRVAEGRADPRPRIRREVLRMPDFAENHNGGQITWGPGGLWIGTGDGGGAGDPERTALDTNSLQGKILRIWPWGDPYRIPPDNPFADGKGGLPEIYSIGLRNPWRFSISDGRIWIGDVGQDREEEISVPTLRRARGGSFGWSAWEGNLRFNGDQQSENPITPILTYRDGCSVVGGVQVPSGPLRGRYLYGDFCEGRIRSFRLEGGRARDRRGERIVVPGLVSFAIVRNQVLLVSLEGEVWRLYARQSAR